MPTYKEIGDAFGKYCEDSWALRDQAFAVGRAVFGSLKARGQLSEEVFKEYPLHLDELDFKTTYTVPGAMRYNTETGLWELGAVLDVRRGNDIFPHEYLRLTFTIRQTTGDYTVALMGSDVSASFAPKDTPETKTAIDNFADRVLEAIILHYTSMRNRWLEEGKVRVIGFSAR